MPNIFTLKLLKSLLEKSGFTDVPVPPTHVCMYSRRKTDIEHKKMLIFNTCSLSANDRANVSVLRPNFSPVTHKRLNAWVGLVLLVAQHILVISSVDKVRS